MNQRVVVAVAVAAGGLCWCCVERAPARARSHHACVRSCVWVAARSLARGFPVVESSRCHGRLLLVNADTFHCTVVRFPERMPESRHLRVLRVCCCRVCEILLATSCKDSDVVRASAFVSVCCVSSVRALRLPQHSGLRRVCCIYCSAYTWHCDSLARYVRRVHSA